MPRRSALCLTALLCLAASPTPPDPAARGLEIAREMDRRDSGWEDSQVELRMVLKAADRREVVRRVRIRSLEVEGDGDKTLVLFDQPRDVQGTAFLTFSHRRGADDQWLYLPALSRVKRIASSNRSGPFMGSEFAFEDVSSEEVERYTYRYDGDEPCAGENHGESHRPQGELPENQRCYVVERMPVDASSGYSRQRVWIDQEHYRPLRVVYYDRKGARLKTLERHGYEQYPGGFWRAARWEMSNHQTGKATEIEWQPYRFGVGLEERDFDLNSLRRLR